MARFIKNRENAKGAAPGSLIFMGKQKMETSKIRLFKYSENDTTKKHYHSINEAINNLDTDKVN